MKINLRIMKDKSQLSMEFFTLAGMAFLAAIIFAGLSVNEMREFKDAKDFFLIKDLGLKLQKEVSIASYVEDGYERDFTLPDKLENSVDYYILTKNTSITINSSKTVFSARIPVIYGKNFTKGSNKIEKINGKVYVNN